MQKKNNVNNSTEAADLVSNDKLSTRDVGSDINSLMKTVTALEALHNVTGQSVNLANAQCPLKTNGFLRSTNR